MKFNNVLLVAILIIFYYCKTNAQQEKRETALDKISHVEDSIIYDIPKLSRLCDEMNIEKKMVDIGNCKLYCEVEGADIPLVVINGGPGGTHHYFHPWFSKIKDVCKVIYYDQRGCGLSDFNSGEGYSFEQAIDDLDNLRKALKIDKWIVAGYSYGGAIAQYYSIKYPENTMAMVLISAVAMVKNDILGQSREGTYISREELEKIRMLYKLRNEGKLSSVQLLYNKDLNGDWKRQNFYKPSKERMIRAAYYEWIQDKNFNSAIWSGVNMLDFKDAFNDCPIPVLLCEGQQDLSWLPEKVEIIKNNHPNAKFVFFEKSGHSIYEDEPELFFTELKSFISSLKVPSPDKISSWKIHTEKMLAGQKEIIANAKLFSDLVKKNGVKAAIEYYNTFSKKNPGKELFVETQINQLGYEFLGEGKIEDAIEIFKLNVSAFPNSWNVYDSLGEAYLAKGDKDRAK